MKQVTSRIRPARLLGPLAVTLSGCAGGVPLLHGAHVLPASHTSFGAGMSDRLLLGDEKRAVADADARPPGSPLPPPGDHRFTRGVLVALSEGPAITPWASARVGIAGSNEAGLSYTGRALRLDARHAFEWQHSALSLGLGLSGRGMGQISPELPGARLDHASGLGLDVPILFGYRTDADLISVWAGARFQYDRWSGNLTVDSNPALALSAHRFAAGPVFGFAVGLPPLWVAAELEVDYAHGGGALEGAGAHDDAQFNGLSVQPAGALIAKF